MFNEFISFSNLDNAASIPARFGNVFGDLRKRRVTFAFNVIPAYGGSDSVQDAASVSAIIRSQLALHGWEVLTVYVTPQIAFYQVELNVNLYENFTAEQAANALINDLGNNYTLSQVIYTDSGFPTSNTNNNTNTNNNGGGVIVGNNTIPTPSQTTGKPDFFTQIGQWLGFDKPNSYFGGLGVTAATGGIIAAFVLVLLLRNKK